MGTAATDGSSTSLILVIGATGNQGGKVARELLNHGHRVRILTRNPEAPAALQLLKAGAEVARGDMGDLFSLDAALYRVTSIFSMSPLDGSGKDSEKLYASTLVQAALKAEVVQFVHASVAGIEQFPRSSAPDSLVNYWKDKWEIEEIVHKAGFTAYTILRPTWIMENLAEPASRFMFPQLKRGEIFTALQADTRLDMIAGDDIAAFARAAFENPIPFNGKTIELAGDSRTMSEVAAALTRVLGKKIISFSLSPAEAVAKGMHPSVVNSQDYRNEVGFQVDIETLKRYGIPLNSFEQWAQKHRDRIVVD